MNKLKAHFTDLFSDEKMVRLFVVAIGALICDVYMYVDSGYKIEPLIRICYCVLFFPMAMIFGRKWVPFQYLIIAFSILYFNKWYNPTSFFLVACVALRHRKYRVPLFVLYGIAVFICLFISRRNWAHGLLHALYCVSIYFIALDIRSEFKRRLKATDEELAIIKQIAEGKEMKEIEGFSEYTIYAKLREARLRNNVRKNYQLVELYEETRRQEERE